MFRRRGTSNEDETTRPSGDTAEDAVEEEELEEPAEDAPEDTEADLESQAADYLADNDLWLYGPNAQDVLDVLDRLEEIEPAEASAIAEAWRSASRSDREEARKAVRKIVEDTGEESRQVRMAREEVGAWLTVASGYPEFAKSVPDWAKTCAVVSEAALDAVTAIILEDDLDEDHYQALISPWNEALDRIEVEEELEVIEGAPGDVDEEDEDEAEAKYGPNASLVEDFLNRLWLLSPEQVARLVSAWENAPEENLELAHEALHDLVEEDTDIRDEVRAAQEMIAPWLNGGRLEETASFIGQTGQSTSRRMAGPALADAVAALVVGDLLAPEDAEVLYAPWFDLVGAPSLPEPADDSDEPKAPAPAPKAAAGGKGAAAKGAAKGPAAKGAAQGAPAKGAPKGPAAKSPARDAGAKGAARPDKARK